MKSTSILHDVLGPVMRGPSSSHTAGSYHIGTLARSLLGEEPTRAELAFDPDGSYGRVYREQGSDLAFVAGLLGWPITDARFPQALSLAGEAGLEVRFDLRPLPNPDHPNTVVIQLSGESGSTLHLTGKSVGGGSVEIIEMDGWPVRIRGDEYVVLVKMEDGSHEEARRLVNSDGETSVDTSSRPFGEDCLICAKRKTPLPPGILRQLEALPGVLQIRRGAPLHAVKHGTPLFSSAATLLAVADGSGLSMGRVALRHEAGLLGLPESKVLAETTGRLEVMCAAVREGLSESPPPMRLLRPTARKIYLSESEGQVAAGGLHTRAAARAMAVMHTNGGMGVVCAAPTAGSAGVLPGVVATLLEDLEVDEEQVALSLLAAGAVGLICSERATFAAEVAGCQVEIGAAGAMAAAAVVEATGGAARQAADAAAISFQNTMGSVCDLVQGIVEIPCHTRNAVAASSAFVCADLILGGYENPIPLDETIDAVYAVGKMLPLELRCTARGGIAVTPSALKLKRPS